jgi:hypothetical protein
LPVNHSAVGGNGRFRHQVRKAPKSVEEAYLEKLTLSVNLLKIGRDEEIAPCSLSWKGRRVDI